MEPALASVGSATVAVLSQSSGIERPFFAMRLGHVVYNNCALYISCCCTNHSAVASTAVVRVVSATRGLCNCVLGTPSSCIIVITS